MEFNHDAMQKERSGSETLGQRVSDWELPWRFFAGVYPDVSETAARVILHFFFPDAGRNYIVRPGLLFIIEKNLLETLRNTGRWRRATNPNSKFRSTSFILHHCQTFWSIPTARNLALYHQDLSDWARHAKAHTEAGVRI